MPPALAASLTRQKAPSGFSSGECSKEEEQLMNAFEVFWNMNQQSAADLSLDTNERVHRGDVEGHALSVKKELVGQVVTLCEKALDGFLEGRVQLRDDAEIEKMVKEREIIGWREFERVLARIVELKLVLLHQQREVQRYQRQRAEID